MHDGDYEKDPQRKPAATPSPTVVAPKCPVYLKGEGRKEWKRICSELMILKVLSQAERSSLEQYCDAYQKWRECITTLKTDGQYVTTEKGIIEHPAGKAHRSYAALCHKLLCEFGMTPASRTRLVITEDTEQDEQARRFFG
jgi:P27 family predicted phage terminase small subunit